MTKNHIFQLENPTLGTLYFSLPDICFGSKMQSLTVPGVGQFNDNNQGSEDRYGEVADDRENKQDDYNRELEDLSANLKAVK